MWTNKEETTLMFLPARDPHERGERRTKLYILLNFNRTETLPSSLKLEWTIDNDNMQANKIYKVVTSMELELSYTATETSCKICPAWFGNEWLWGWRWEGWLGLRPSSLTYKDVHYYYNCFISLLNNFFELENDKSKHKAPIKH